MKIKAKLKSKSQAYQEIRREWKQDIRRKNRMLSWSLKLKPPKDASAEIWYVYVERMQYLKSEISTLQNYLNMFKAEE